MHIYNRFVTHVDCYIVQDPQIVCGFVYVQLRRLLPISRSTCHLLLSNDLIHYVSLVSQSHICENMHCSNASYLPYLLKPFSFQMDQMEHFA